MVMFHFLCLFLHLFNVARLMRDNQTGRIKGFDFVKYSSQAEADKDMKAMDGRVCALFTCRSGYKLDLMPIKTGTWQFMNC
uniref:RRM domain-containing protein n=1 Tax=Arundo donax TaxID=35708 RepID=A0A0A8ZMX6_ARUDO